jgi:hypothetical protein
MRFDVHCACGIRHTVSEGAAGAQLTCSCGQTVAVPSLDRLRESVGLGPTRPNPEMVIESLLAAGHLPETHDCVWCGKTTHETIIISTECERAFKKRETGGWFLTLILFAAFGIFALLKSAVYRGESCEEEYGRDRIYPLPVPLCLECQAPALHALQLKQLLASFDSYRRLLDKYPEAKVSLQSKSLNRFDGFS